MTTSKVNFAFVSRATYNQLFELATLVAGMSKGKINHAQSTGGTTKLASTIGTKLGNNPTYSAAFADGGFDYTWTHAQAIDDTLAAEAYAQAQAAEQAAAASKATEPQPEATKRTTKDVVSAKQWIRELLAGTSGGVGYTLDELCAMSGKSAVNIRTMLSDLRSSKYCGAGGVFATKSTRVGGKVYYSQA